MVSGQEFYCIKHIRNMVTFSHKSLITMMLFFCYFNSGLIGGNWAMLFAAGGYSVVLYDISNDIIQKALDGIQTKLGDMEMKNILRGTLTAKQQFDRISGSSNLKDVVAGAKFIQVCIRFISYMCSVCSDCILHVCYKCPFVDIYKISEIIYGLSLNQ